MDPFTLLSLLEKVDESHSSITGFYSDSENTLLRLEENYQPNEADQIIMDSYYYKVGLEKEAVKLVEDYSSSQEEQKDVPKLSEFISLPQKESINKDATKGKNSVKSPTNSYTDDGRLIVKLETCFAKLGEMQVLIDQGVYEKTGPGRRRSNPYKTSTHILKAILDYLKTSFKNIISNDRCSKRKDAMTTFFFRALKKLAYFLTMNFATKNSYKHCQREEFISSFAEAHFSFLTAIGMAAKVDLKETFAEFIILYYQEEKAQDILNAMMRSEY